jgi:hypothetical protein
VWRLKVRVRAKGEVEAVEGFCRLLRDVVDIEAQTPILSNSPEVGVHRFLDVVFEEAKKR